MTRIVSTNFVGVVTQRAMRGAVVRYGGWLKEVIGDTALTADRVLGLNGATPIDHTGAPNGCPPGLALMCQAVPGRLISTTTTEFYHVVAVPIYVAAGEDVRDWVVEVDIRQEVADGTETCFAQVRDTSFVVEETVPLTVTTVRAVDGAETWRGACPALVEGWHYLTITRTARGGACTLHGVRVFPEVYRDARTVGAPIAASAANGNPFAAFSTFSPGDVVDFHRGEVANVTSPVLADNGVNAWVLTRIAKLQNTLWEWVTGARIPGNADRQCSTTRTHDQSVFTAEGRVPIPVFAAALGGATLDGTGKTIRTQMPGWSLSPTHNASPVNCAKLAVMMPSFNSTSSKFAARVLCQIEAGTATNWRFRVASGAGTSSWVALSSIDGTWYTAEITGVPFDAATVTDFTLQADHTGSGATSDRIAITGWTGVFTQ